MSDPTKLDLEALKDIVPAMKRSGMVVLDIKCKRCKTGIIYGIKTSDNKARKLREYHEIYDKEGNWIRSEWDGTRYIDECEDCREKYRYLPARLERQQNAQDAIEKYNLARSQAGVAPGVVWHRKKTNEKHIF